MAWKWNGLILYVTILIEITSVLENAVRSDRTPVDPNPAPDLQRRPEFRRIEKIKRSREEN